MNLAAIFALLLQTGACARSEFRAPDGSTLSVLVCPLVTAPAADERAPPTDERHA